MRKTDWARMTRRAILAAVAISATGLSGVMAQANDKVKIGALRFTSHAPGFIALEKGYFAEEGIDAEFVFFQAAQPIAVAGASGDVDFGIAGVTGGFMNLAEQGAIRLVAGVLHEKKGVDGMMILASNEAHAAGLTTPEGLPGKRVAMTQVGSTFHYMTAKVGDSLGFGIDEVRMVPLQGVGQMIAALSSGQVDAMIMVPHIAKPMVRRGDAKQIGWLYDHVEYQISGLFTTVPNIENNRDLVERFVRAYAKGIADFNRVMLDPAADPAERDEMVAMIAAYVSPDKPVAEAATAILEGSMNLNDGAALNVTDVETQMKWFQDQGLVSKDLTVDMLVDRSFVETY